MHVIVLMAFAYIKEEVMTEDEILREFEVELKNKFPELVANDNQNTFDVMQKVLLDFVLPLQKEKLFVYMKGRGNNTSVAQHIADLPQGVHYFENWLKSGLLTFASNILSSLQSTLGKDKVYLTFAHLLDNKNIELFFECSNFTKEDEEKLLGIFTPFLSDPELNLFLQALSCISVGLENSAKSLLKLWIQKLWCDGKDIQSIIEQAKILEAIKEHASKAGKLGAEARWSAKESTQEFAIDLMLKGAFKNPNQAADAIAEEVIIYGTSVGFSFSNNFQAQKTIYNWLRTYKNRLSKSEDT